ncbi:MAG: hypothetical protein ABI649_01150 [Gaiellaceae bacterium]
MADTPLPDEIDELIWSELAEQPLTERLWEAGDAPIDMDAKDLLTLTRAANRGFRAAILRLADEVEQLKARDERFPPPLS